MIDKLLDRHRDVVILLARVLLMALSAEKIDLAARLRAMRAGDAARRVGRAHRDEW